MRDPAPWQKRYGTMWVIALFLGFIGQYLFVDRPAGVSMPLFALGFYALFFYSIKGRIGGFDKWKGQSRMGWLLLIPIALLTLTYAIYANEVFRALNWIALPILIVAQTMLLTRSGSQSWHRVMFYSELLKQWLITPLNHLGVPIGMTAEWMRSGEDVVKPKSNVKKIGFGLILATPLLIVVIALLASADGIFQSWINSIPNGLDGDAIGTAIMRIIVGACIALYTFCYIWGLLFRKTKPVDMGNVQVQLPGQSNDVKNTEPSKLDPITAITVLICVNLVYVVFAVIQFSYLFGAAEGLIPAGTAYAEYARRGFAELVLIALINIGILLGGLHFISTSSVWLGRIRKLLLSLLMGCTIVMLISAYSRLSLYEEAYGYTSLRLLVHGFMIFLGVLMVVSLIRIWYGRFSLAKVYIVLAIVSYVIMNYANLDSRIATNNIDRYERTAVIDIDYLWSLSADAGPELIKFYKDHPELEKLAPIINNLRVEASSRNHWQSWNLAFQRLNSQ
ncbi:DUF4173 domain-containing protein [Paenibacillus sp. GSMTC-2017]|uniref:DUF4153 domain-containing protein n=1 Tax=Paenibacillus sp. GSMTC-2017 TaxID=2794350 RepID=UPI0018D66AE0|nr:DUF4173 domain-containing protein [Paenibacillus sp. GSMTC-2017]MBH5319940.1 DUF4173 domain-containing protein [Paenibacillus sp. GSMTC-2017]